MEICFPTQQSQLSDSHLLKDADQQTEAKDRQQAKKRKPIHKETKKIYHETSSQATETKLIRKTTMASPFPTEKEKYEILDEYFCEGIGDYYLSSQQLQQLPLWDSLSEKSSLQLTEIFDVDSLQGSPECGSSELMSYLEIVQQIVVHGNEYQILEDQSDRSFYCVFKQGHQTTMIEISQLQRKMLENREIFRRKYEKSVQNFNPVILNCRKPSLSPLSFEIAFLSDCLNREKKMLATATSALQRALLEKFQSDDEAIVGEDAEDAYLSYLLKKLVASSSNEVGDLLNFFRDNEIREHNLNVALGALAENRDLEEFLRKKKQCRSSKTARTILHTACLGCMSSYCEQANPFVFCIDCGVRFHQFCSPGVGFGQKNLLCMGCYDKRIDPLSKTCRRECFQCGVKGLIFIPLDENSSVHTFCLLTSGQWKISQKKLSFAAENCEKNLRNKCALCGISNTYTRGCECCQNYAHPICAFLAGWKMQIYFEKKNAPKQFTMSCCEAGNEKRMLSRKFILNYKKYAFRKI